MFVRYFDPQDLGPGDYLEELGLLIDRSRDPDDLRTWFDMIRWDASIVLSCALPPEVPLPPEGGAIVVLGSAPTPLPPGVLHLPRNAPRQKVLETVLICRQRASRRPPPSALLRGLAHAINNPVASALGWAQLFPSGHERAVEGVVTELRRVEQLARALGVIGLRPSVGRSPLRLLPCLVPAVDRAREQGLGVELKGEVKGALLADAGELQLLFDLIFAALVEEKRRIPRVRVLIGEDEGMVEVRLEAPGAAFPTHLSPDDLCGLLEEGRRTKALAMAVAHAVVVKRLGGRVEVNEDSLLFRAPSRGASAVDLDPNAY